MLGSDLNSLLRFYDFIPLPGSLNLNDWLKHGLYNNYITCILTLKMKKKCTGRYKIGSNYLQKYILLLCLEYNLTYTRNFSGN